MELALYNSVLSGISLNGKNFLYTNPLAYSDDLPFKQRWSKDRVPYIALSNCCPPNVVRTIAEVGDYACSISEKGLWFHLYGGNIVNTTLADGSRLTVEQETAYPWEGNIRFSIKSAGSKAFSMFFRIPGWATKAVLKVNGKGADVVLNPGSYAELNRKWKAGDQVELSLPMDAQLVEANPLVEENRNQVAVKRGPVVYCLESPDMPGKRIFNVSLPANIALKASAMKIEGTEVMALEGVASWIEQKNWTNVLYRPITDVKTPVPIKLVPYFAWGNRGHSEMSVWLPLSR
jgi:DUF1680 family protein